MSVIAESNITLQFPDDNYFRFSDCQGYTSLSGYYFKEMDACWYDAENNIYWLIELKDYSGSNLTSETIEQKSWDITRKAIDSLCMLLSCKHAYDYGAKITPCLPALLNEQTQLKFITIIHCNENQKINVQHLHNQFRIKFKPYAELFGISNYAVIEHSMAAALIPKQIVR